MKRLVIHFGVHRTGTTALQNTLKSNRSLLLEHGILYPELGYGCDHSKISWGLIKNKVGTHSIDPQWLVNKIKDEEESSTKMIILSHEDFSLIEDTIWLEALKTEYHVEAVIYLRRQDIWLESWYNQHIKWPWTRKFSSATPQFFLKNYADFFWIDYKNLLQKISNSIGKDNIYTNVVDILGVKNTTLDFLHRLDIDFIEPVSTTDTNASLSSARIDLLRRINLITLRNNVKAKVKILKELEKLDISEDNGSKLVFTDDEISFILNEFSQSNKFVAREYFNREELFGDPIISDREPRFISDHKAYRIYLPRLLKEIAKTC